MCEPFLFLEGGPSPHLFSPTLLPLQLIDSIGFRYTPLYKDRDFLHRKYLVEGLSIRQIAAEISSSKTSVFNALKRFQIPFREKTWESRRAAHLTFGMKRRRGKLVAFQAEQRVISAILKMHAEGMSTSQIVRVLTEMKVPTKQNGRAWLPEMVRRIIKSAPPRDFGEN